MTLKGSSVVKANKGQIGGIFLKSGTLTMLGSSSIRDHRQTTSDATVAIAVDDLPATFTMRDRSVVTDNRVQSGWAAVLKIACPSGTPTFVGVKARVTGNTPKNIKAVCP